MKLNLTIILQALFVLCTLSGCVDSDSNESNISSEESSDSIEQNNNIFVLSGMIEYEYPIKMVLYEEPERIGCEHCQTYVGYYSYNNFDMPVHFTGHMDDKGNFEAVGRDISTGKVLDYFEICKSDRKPNINMPYIMMGVVTNSSGERLRFTVTKSADRSILKEINVFNFKYFEGDLYFDGFNKSFSDNLLYKKCDDEGQYQLYTTEEDVQTNSESNTLSNIEAKVWDGETELAGVHIYYALSLGEGTYILYGVVSGIEHLEIGTYNYLDANQIEITTTKTKSKEGFSGSLFKLESGVLRWYLDDGEYFMTLE